jgi:hypothetical protein
MVHLSVLGTTVPVAADWLTPAAFVAVTPKE